MNYRSVLKVYTLLRQLTDEETALLTTLRNMSESEHELMVQALSPQSKSTKKPGKKATKKVAARADRCTVVRDGVVCSWYADALVHTDKSLSSYHQFSASSKKSARASGMAAAIGRSLDSQRRVTATDDDLDNAKCQYLLEGGEKCEMSADNNIHHLQTHTLYHPFVSPSPALDAELKSSSKKNDSTEASASSTASGTKAAGVGIAGGD